MKTYGKILRMALRLDYNLVIFDTEEQKWQSMYDQPEDQRQIDIWYERGSNGSLMLLLGYLMTRDSFWSNASLRVLLPIEDNNPQATEEALVEELDQFRIVAEAVIVEDQDSETIIAHSKSGSLVFLPVILREGKIFDGSGAKITHLLQHLPIVAMVLAAQDIQLDAEPDTGIAGQLAEAEDLFTAATQRVEDAEAALDKIKEDFDLNLKKMITARHDDESKEELESLHKNLERIKVELDKATRRSAKADAKREDTQHELEQFREKYHLFEDEKDEE